MGARPFGSNVTVDDVDGAIAFYAPIYGHHRVQGGVFAGIRYAAIVGDDDEVVLCAFERGEGNPLADEFPTVRVDSVADTTAREEALGGEVLLPPCACPCTAADFAIVKDPAGNQFMVEEGRRAAGPGT